MSLCFSARFSAASLALLACILLATIIIQFLLWPHFADDAYISLRYAARLLNGHGLTFNNGEYVEGFSNPLWLLITAGASWLTGLNLIVTAKLLGYASLGLTCLALFSIARTLGAPLVFVLATGILAATPGVQVYAGLGMEVPFMMALISWGIAFSLAATTQHPSMALAAAACFALLAITRPEGPLYTALWGMTLAAIWLRERPERETFKLLSLMAVVAVTPFMAYLAFRLQYYGAWLPNTAIAKQPDMWGNSSFVMEWAPYLFALAVLLAVTIRCHAILSGTLLRLYAFSGAMAGAALIFSLYAGADWMAFGRFLLPVWPVVLTATLASFAMWLQANPRSAAITTALVLLYAGFGLLMATPYISNVGFAPMLMRGTDQAAAGQWIEQNFSTPMTIGTARLGGASYFAPSHTFLDFLGLTDAVQARYVRSHWPDSSTARISPNNPIITERQPDALLIHRAPTATGMPVYTPAELELLQPRYTCIRQFPQGNWGTFDLWVKAQIAMPNRENCTL